MQWPIKSSYIITLKMFLSSKDLKWVIGSLDFMNDHVCTIYISIKQVHFCYSLPHANPPKCYASKVNSSHIFVLICDLLIYPFFYLLTYLFLEILEIKLMEFIMLDKYPNPEQHHSLVIVFWFLQSSINFV